MAENGIPQAVHDFLASEIESVLELEVLLLLQGSAPRGWSAEQLATTLKIDPDWAGGLLVKFAQRGLLARRDEPAPRYAYAPASAELDAAVRAVADAYATHRVRIIGLIFSKPTSNLKSFAEAFRLRRDPKETKDPKDDTSRDKRDG